LKVIKSTYYKTLNITCSLVLKDFQTAENKVKYYNERPVNEN